MFIEPGALTLSQCRTIVLQEEELLLPKSSKVKVNAAQTTLRQIIDRGDPLYGITTGFGSLMNVNIAQQDRLELQRRIILSHATGVGPHLPDAIVRLILALKINTLAQGYSGVRYEMIEALLALYHNHVYPCVPAKGSVGASGDLAPLAHIGAALLGQGKVRYNNKILDAKEGMAIAGINESFWFEPKEGLSMVNGTQVSTAIALQSVFTFESVFTAALIAGALTMKGVRGNLSAFDPIIHQARRHVTQQKVAQLLYELCAIATNSPTVFARLQDPYSLRCQPQVMGACLAQLQQATCSLGVEVNGVTDNPLISVAEARLLSGGNFHAEPVAFAADNIALAIAETGSLSERRISFLMDSQRSGLPPFLVKSSGLNSGFMLAQVTAAALTSENKTLAYPASVDSIPTSAGQEDHVSMSTHAAYRLLEMTENVTTIVAIELLAACQAIDLNAPIGLSSTLQKVYDAVRQRVPYYEKDRFFAPDINAIVDLIKTGYFSTVLPTHFSLTNEQENTA